MPAFSCSRCPRFLACSSHACLSRRFATNFPSSLGGTETVPLRDLGIDLNAYRCTEWHSRSRPCLLPKIKDAILVWENEELAWNRAVVPVLRPHGWMDTVRKLGFQPWLCTRGLCDLGQITQPFWVSFSSSLKKISTGLCKISARLKDIRAQASAGT